jgi:hypothetical protein
MKWIGNRISIVDDKGKTTIVIRPEDKIWVKSLMGSWTAMWYTIGVTVVWSYFMFELTKQEKIAVFVFMTFWAYYAIRVTRTFLWIMWGRELIKINEASFLYKKSIKSYGKAVPYYLENIQKIAVNFPERNSLQWAWESSPWIQGGERLEFEYKGKIVRFARKLNEKDAKLLFNLITKRIEDQLKKRKY